MNQTAQPKADFEIPKPQPNTRQRNRFYKITNLTSYLKSQSSASSPSYSKSQWLTLGTLLLILPALLFGMRNRTFEQIAAILNPSTAFIYIDPNTHTTLTQGSFTISVEQPPQTTISSVQTTLHFDPTQIQITHIQTTPQLADTLILTSTEQANQTGLINISLASKTNQSGPTQPFPLATITYQVITPQVETISPLLLNPVENKVYTSQNTPLQIQTQSGHILIKTTSLPE